MNTEKILILVACLAFTSPALSFSDQEQAMIEWVDAHQEEAVALLEQTVNTGSGTMNHAGVKAVGMQMADAMTGLGLEVE